MVTLERFELPTCGLGNRRSIHLSYRATHDQFTVCCDSFSRKREFALMAKDEFILRPYRKDDLPDLYVVEDLCFAKRFRFGRKELRDYVESKTAVTWVAETVSGLAGFANADLRGKGVRYGYLQTIDIVPEYRRHKIASALLAKVELGIMQAGSRGMGLHVSVTNEPAIRLYEKHGYSRIGVERKFYRDAGDAFVYWKSLD